MSIAQQEPLHCHEQQQQCKLAGSFEQCIVFHIGMVLFFKLSDL